VTQPSVIGDVISQDPCFFRGTFWDGGDASVRAQLLADPVDPLTPGAFYTRTSFTKIVYTLKRIWRGTVTNVTGHTNKTLTISSVIENTPLEWSVDSRGYNFHHVIDEAELFPVADYVIDYVFTLASPSDFDFSRCAKFQYLGAVDAGATPEPDPDPDPDPDPAPDDGVDPLLFSSITPVTVNNSAVETTLLPAVNDVFQIDADTWIAGGVFSGEADGVLGTVDELPVDIQVRLKLAGDIVLLFDIARGDLPTAQEDLAWKLDWSFTLVTSGASGTVSGVGEFRIVTTGGTTITRMSATGVVAIDTTEASPVACTVEWGNADSDNTITRVKFIGRMAEVPSV